MFACASPSLSPVSEGDGPRGQGRGQKQPPDELTEKRRISSGVWLPWLDSGAGSSLFLFFSLFMLRDRQRQGADTPHFRRH